MAAKKTCGSLDEKDVDRFFFEPTKATRLDFAANGVAAFDVGDFSGTVQYRVLRGQAIVVGPSDGAWYVVGGAPTSVRYEIHVETAP